MQPTKGGRSPKMKYGTGIRTQVRPMDAIFAKSRSVMYSLRWISILASYTSFDSWVGR